MTSTPVGMRCPECASQKTQVRNPIGAAGRSDAPATYALIAIYVAAYHRRDRDRRGRCGGGGGTLIRDGALFAYGVDAAGQTARGRRTGSRTGSSPSAFLHAGVLHIGLNMFALYILGTLLEPAIGTVRFVGIYAVSILCWVVPGHADRPGRSSRSAPRAAIFGLMAAAFLIARNRGLDELASQIGFFVILNLVITFGVNNISVGGHIGGLIGGGDRGAARRAARPPADREREGDRDRRTGWHVRGRGGRGADRRRLLRARQPLNAERH